MRKMLAILSALTFSTPWLAYGSEVKQVEGIGVEEKLVEGTDVRATAFEKARDSAIRRYLGIPPESPLGMTSREADAAIAYIQVEEEKNRGDTYRAKFTVGVRPEKLPGYVAETDEIQTAVIPERIGIIPVSRYMKDNVSSSKVAWENDAWTETWASRTMPLTEKISLSYIQPEVSDFAEADSRGVDGGALADLAEKYGFDAVAAVELDSTVAFYGLNGSAAAVKVTYWSKNSGTYENSIQVEGDPSPERCAELAYALVLETVSETTGEYLAPPAQAQIPREESEQVSADLPDEDLHAISDHVLSSIEAGEWVPTRQGYVRVTTTFGDGRRWEEAKEFLASVPSTVAYATELPSGQVEVIIKYFGAANEFRRAIAAVAHLD